MPLLGRQQVHFASAKTLVAIYDRFTDYFFFIFKSTEGIKGSMSRVHSERHNLICASLKLCPGV